jgi:hypothetical protein
MPVLEIDPNAPSLGRVQKCKHHGCDRRAIEYNRDGIEIVACKKHWEIIIDYLKNESIKSLAKTPKI